MQMERKGKEAKTVGRKQTFMLDQFQNECIFEQELFFGGEDVYHHQTTGSFKDGSFASVKNDKELQAKLFVKIQLIENEVEKLEECLY